MILAADIGATKTELCVYEVKSKKPQKVFGEIYPSRKFSTPESLLKDFLKKLKYKITAACIGIPGPVIDGKGKATNISWKFDERKLSEFLNIKKFKLVNDLEALAAAVTKPDRKELIEIYRGKRTGRNENKVVLAPGTGLGQAALIWNGEKYLIVPTEGGHADFAPKSNLEAELLDYLRKEFGHVSYERVASGEGIVNIFEFLTENNYGKGTGKLLKRFIGEDKASVISDEALNKRNKLCNMTLDIFMSALGSQAGNMVLNFKATGGVFLGGGIPLKLRKKFSEAIFINSYLNKGKLSYLTKQTPVQIININSASTLGAAIIASQL